MTAVIIIVGVLSVIVLALFLPVTAKLKAEDGTVFKLFYAGICVYNGGKKEESEEEKPQSDRKDEEKPKSDKNIKDYFLAEYKKLGTADFLKKYFEVLKDILERLLWFIRKLNFKLLLFDLSVGTDNAFDTAVEYGICCSAVYPLLSVIISNAKVKMKKINIRSDFNSTGYRFKAEIDAKVSLVYYIAAAIFLARIYAELKNGKYKVKEKENE